jgi:FkbM family methyltransferase
MHDRNTMNMKRFKRYRPDWDWKGLSGSAACIKWGFRDLESLDKTLQLVKRKHTVVQAGGNIGLFPKRLAEEFKVVHTFEPDAQLFKHMQLNAPEKNIVMHQCAIGDSNAGVRLAHVRRDASGRPEHEGLTHVAGEGEIPQIKIDDMKLRHCDLIYLDIEGYELNALRGARATILTNTPVIAVEVNRNITYYGQSAEELRLWLRECGYTRVLESHSDEVFIHEDH